MFIGQREYISLRHNLLGEIKTFIVLFYNKIISHNLINSYILINMLNEQAYERIKPKHKRP